MGFWDRQIIPTGLFFLAKSALSAYLIISFLSDKDLVLPFLLADYLFKIKTQIPWVLGTIHKMKVQEKKPQTKSILISSVWYFPVKGLNVLFYHV